MHSETPDIVPFASQFKRNSLSKDQIETLRNGTLHLLEEVGVHIPSKKALEIFSENGALVDMDKQVVRIQPDLVTNAMSSAPRSFILAGREERFDLHLDGSYSYLCNSSCAPYTIDLESGKQRYSRKKDVEQYTVVSDALPLQSFIRPIVSAQDYGPTAPVHECHALLTNTLKHVRGGTTVHPKLTRYIVELAITVAGGKEACRHRPPINANICTISPLAQDAHGIESALIYAEAGIPVSFHSMPTMCSTAPASPLSALVLGDAEVVSGMVLIQLAYPGAPVFHCIQTCLMEPRTGDCLMDLTIPAGQVAVQLAHSWDVPCFGGGMVSMDPQDIGWQSTMYDGIGAALIALWGAEITGFLGLLAGATVAYPEKMILEHETCQTAYSLLHDFDFDEAEMALDVVKKVGPCGNFLIEDHTLEHMRDFKMSQLARQRNVEGVLRDPREVALEKFKKTIETHHPKPLPKEILVELERIVEMADREAESLR